MTGPSRLAISWQVDGAILATVRAMHRRGLIPGCVGNVSARQGRQVRITPTRVSYERMRRKDLVTVDMLGRRISGTRSPSSEMQMHLAIYRSRPTAGAVVHTHSPQATAWSFLTEPLPVLLEEQAYYALGQIAVAAPAPSGSAALADAAVEALGESSAALLGGHGVVAVGGDCEEALAKAEVVEQVATVTWLLRRSLSVAQSVESKATSPAYPK